MNKYIYILLLIIFAFQAHSNTEHLKGIKKIEMEVLRNGEVIGYSNYFFDHGNDKMTVKNYTKFKVELFGVSVFSVSSETIEGYENNELIYFELNQEFVEKFSSLLEDKNSDINPYYQRFKTHEFDFNVKVASSAGGAGGGILFFSFSS